MNKRFFYVIMAIITILAFYFKNEIANIILYEFNNIKKNIIEIYDTANFKITSYFNQAKQIQKLTIENKEYRNYIESILPILQSYKQLKQFKTINNPNVVFTQTISYATLPDISAIYVSYSDNNNNKDNNIKGLIFNNTAAGIITKKYKNYSLALLNINPNTSYTVFIGKNKIPGIIFGGKEMKIKYIPKYKQIKIGDLVVTSGLDKIFYEGVRVGKIISVTQQKLYQEAVIKPFYNSYNPTFFYVVNFNKK